MSERAVCRKCWRPVVACFCDRIVPLESRTRVCILRHPRERKVAVGTAWMAHLALPNSELHHGVDFGDHARVRELVATPGTALLFPGPSAVAPEDLPAPPGTLIVIDGTWSQARKLLHVNPLLATLPRVGFTPPRPSNYRIRRQPAAECVSTIEAVAHVLGALERAPARFLPLLAPFERMVDLQLEFKARGGSPPRTRRRRKQEPRRDRTLDELRARRRDLVAVYAESNGEPPELVRLSALRPASGERFDALIAPRLAPASDLPANLEVPLERILAGSPLADALQRFTAFLREGDLLCGWGRYAESLLLAAGAQARPFADLRVAVSRAAGRRPSGVEQAVRLLGQPALPEPVFEGRAGRRLAALGAVLSLLLG